MKKHFVTLLVVLLSVSSCIEMDMSKVGNTQSSINVEEKFQLTQPYELPIVDGQFTVVTRGEDTLAVTGIPMSIEIPKGVDVVIDAKSYAQKKTLQNDIIIEYIKDLPKYDLNQGVFSRDYVIVFEDSKVNDYDYNDLVLYVEHKILKSQSKYKLEVRVKPIALGSAKLIQFGYDDLNTGSERMLSYDVRKDYFNNEKGFINTYKQTLYKEVIPVLPMGKYDDDEVYSFVPDLHSYEQGAPGSYMMSRNPIAEGFKYNQNIAENKKVKGGYISYAPVIESSNHINGQHNISYFIKVDNGVKYSVASIDTRIKDCLPYGLAIPGEFYYPYEYTPIWDAYPDFMEWIDGRKPSFHNGDKNSTNVLPEHVFEQEGMEALFRW